MKPGEVIVSVDGIATPIVDALATALAQLRPGATVPIVVEHRDGKQTTLHVTLGTYPGR
jgi:S1-C subfamily serine protease